MASEIVIGSDSEILIYDDFLSAKNADNIERYMLGNWFPWYLSNGIDYENDGNYQMVHNFFKDKLWITYDRSILNPILERLYIKELLKIKANLVLKPYQKFDFHIDVSNKFAKTAIYYVNNNNGKTVFKDTGEVDCKKNRLVIFPSSLYHTGISNTDDVYGGKCVINFNFLN